jgi:hypothetical protein
MKFRRIRGPNCVDARVSARIVIENTRPTTVISAAAIAVRIWRAASAEPLFTHAGRSISPWYAARSMRYVAMNKMPAATISTAGTTQSVVRIASRPPSEPRISHERKCAVAAATGHLESIDHHADQASRRANAASYRQH